MGFAKEKITKDNANGFNSGMGIYICDRHIKDKGIRDFIRLNSIIHDCIYCGAKKSTSLDDVTNHIMQCVKMFYEDPINGNGLWDNEEHQWLENCYNTQELLGELIPHIEPYKLQEQIFKMVFDAQWIKKGPEGYAEDDLLYYDWEFFGDILKHQMRFVFYKTKVKRRIDMCDCQVEPYSILQDIGKIMHQFPSYFYTVLDPLKDFAIFRARQHDAKTIISKGSDLGSPPRNKAKANRFSPAGIPMFYGSDDEETAISEVIMVNPDMSFITTGRFIIQKKLRLVDLTNLPRLSIFDKAKNHSYLALNFLSRFINDISKPVQFDGSEHIDYVPTQVVTEYIRYVMSDTFKKKNDGIKYESIKNSGHFCYVLFLDEEQSTQNDTDIDKDLPLCLDIKSLKTKNTKEIRGN